MTGNFKGNEIPDGYQRVLTTVKIWFGIGILVGLLVVSFWIAFTI